MTSRFVGFAAGYDLDSFDCGAALYNEWLRRSAARAQSSGTARVYLLIDADDLVRGYFAISPTAVVRDELPSTAGRGAPDPVPGFLLAKLALDRTWQGDASMAWGTQLIVEALRRIVAAADHSGGRVIVVDADNAGLVAWYRAHSFLPASERNPLRLYMKVATARAQLAASDTV